MIILPRTVSYRCFRSAVIAVIVSFSFGTQLRAQDPTQVISAGRTAVLTPLEVCQKVFGREEFPDLMHHVTGEYNGQPNGKDLPLTTQVQFRPLAVYPARAVVDMTMSDSTGKAVDVYIHLELDTVWKIRSIRALALIGMVEGIYNELASLTPLQVDELIMNSRKDKTAYALFHSKTEYDYLLTNSKLTIAADDTIVQYWVDHKAEFEKLRTTIEQQLSKAKKARKAIDPVFEKLLPQAKKLVLSGLSYASACNDCIAFKINSMVDNAVGYMYVAPGKAIPEMSPSHYIMIRSIGSGWYLFKTN